MAKVLNYESQIQQGELVQSWHVSQSVDAFTGVEDYAISISGSVNLTSSLSIEPTLLLTTGQNYVLTYNNTTGQVFKALTSSLDSKVHDGFHVYQTGSDNNNIIPSLFGNNKATSSYAVVAGGQCNTASAVGTFIGSGVSNTASITNSSIVGGQLNRLSGGVASRAHDFIGGGCGNSISTYYGCNVIVGGKGSSISGYNSRNFIGGGCLHTINGGGKNTIVGGGNNCIYTSGPFASNEVIVGGICNCLTATGGGSNSIVAGTCNSISNSYTGNNGAEFNSFIGGGSLNTISSYSENLQNPQLGNNSIVGGVCNKISLGCSCGYSFIGGGFKNTASSACSGILGGGNNTILSDNSAIMGGCGHDICLFSNNSIIGGGTNNTIISSSHGAILSGINNSVNEMCSVIAGGHCNVVQISANNLGYNFIGGGQCNQTACGGSAVLGGAQNDANGCLSFIGGGFINKNNMCYGVIAGGCDNKLASTGCRSSIVGGDSNIISSSFSFIGGGERNTSSGANFSAILGGCSNSITHENSFIIGSNLTSSNVCTTSVNNIFISGGLRDFTNNLGTANYILSTTGTQTQWIANPANTHGEYHVYRSASDSTNIEPVIGDSINSGSNSVINGGCKNSITSAGNCSTIGGGMFNTSSACFNSIGGGCNNSVNACLSYIGSGQNNTVAITGLGGVGIIVGGQTNCVGGSSKSYGFIGGGATNTVCSCAGTILNGLCNDIETGDFSTIINGRCNCISSTNGCSAILGGCSNTITHEKSFIIGSDLSSSAACTTFVNRINISGSITHGNAADGWIILQHVSESLNYSNDTDAAAGGVPLGGLYRSGNVISIRIV